MLLTEYIFLQSIYEPKNETDETPFMTSTKLLHVSALGCHPQGVKKSRIKEYKFNTLLYDSLRMAPQCQPHRCLTLVMNCILLSAFVCWYIDSILGMYCLTLWLNQVCLNFIIICWFIQFKLTNSNLKLKRINSSVIHISM